VNHSDESLRDLLELAVGEPPRWLSLDAVRRRAIRYRAVQAGVVTLAVFVAAGVGATIATGAVHGRPPATNGSRLHAGPPPYYIVSYYDIRTKQQVISVRATATRRQIAIVREPKPGLQCYGSGAGEMAAADHQTFYMACSRPVSLDTFIYRFRLTSSGHVTGESLIKGGILRGLWGDNIAVTPNGSEVAVEVLRPGPSGKLYTNTVPEGIFVINTATGSRVLWHSGPYRPGTNQYADASEISFTRNGSELVVLELRCPRGRYRSNCIAYVESQVRAYSPAARGGSLEAGRILLDQSDRKSLTAAFISPDGSALNAVLTPCPRRGTCTLLVVRISVATRKVLRVLYRTRAGTASNGVPFGLFSSDPSGRYFLLVAGGKGQNNGWIDHGKLVPLYPNGLIDYEVW
jgi:hypothetical protein